MAFPDDYRRVQMAGGVAADVAVHTGLPRQIIVDSEGWQVHIMDGVTEGGRKVQMQHDLPNVLQGLPIEGEAIYVALGTDGGPGNPDVNSRLWKSSKLKALFDKFATFAMNGSNTDFTMSIRDEALRGNLRTSSQLITDLNNGTQTGWYRFIPSATLNMPADMSTAGANQAMMQTIAQAVNNLTQVVFARDGSGKIWVRTRTDGEWPAVWTLATGVTTGDLAAYLKRSGVDAMTGKHKLVASTALQGASLNLPQGVAPTDPADGDVWGSGGQLLTRIAGTTRALLDSGLFASDAEYRAGAATGKLVSPSNIGYWSSANLSPAPSQVGNIAHTLGVVPRRIALTLTCKIPNNNYAAGDKIEVVPTWFAIDTRNFGINVWKTDVAIGYQITPQGFLLHQKGAVTGFTPTAAQWDLLIEAWK